MRAGIERKRALIQIAVRLEGALAGHINTNGPPGVDPSHVAALLKYARTRPSLENLRAYLEALPRSALARHTAAAGPQLERACKEAARGLSDISTTMRAEPAKVVEAFAYVLGLAGHGLLTRERGRDLRTSASRQP